MPRYLLRALSGATGPGQRPSEAPAVVGSRFYDGTAFSLGNANATPAVHTFLYPLDNTPSMDFLLPAPGTGGGGQGVPCKITGGGTAGGGKFSLDVHTSTPPKGSVTYRDGTTDFQSTSLASATCSGSSRAEIKGKGRNNNETVDFVVQVVDRGSSNDSFTLTMTPGGTRGGAVTKGNTQIHKG